MSREPEKRRWHIMGSSVRGASHVRADLPNQDAFLLRLGDGNALPAIVAVSDGHGSEKCFRSDKGSELAVKIAVKSLHEFAGSVLEKELLEIKSLAEQLPLDLTKRWHKAVGEHLSLSPFSEAELERVNPLPNGGSPREDVSQHRQFVPYGATLLAVLICEKYAVYLQLGDGEILAISGKMSQVESPISPDNELIANETTSLCQEEAWKKFRWRFQPVVSSPPDLVLLATDGYPNSFETMDGFRKVASDLLNLLDNDGVASVEERLPQWLEGASREGSGDDVTVGIVYCELTTKRDIPEAIEQDAGGAKEPTNSPPAQPGVFAQFCLALAGVIRILRRWFRRHPSVGLACAVLALVLATYIAVSNRHHFRTTYYGSATYKESSPKHRAWKVEP